MFKEPDIRRSGGGGGDDVNINSRGGAKDEEVSFAYDRTKKAKRKIMNDEQKRQQVR